MLGLNEAETGVDSLNRSLRASGLAGAGSQARTGTPEGSGFSYHLGFRRRPPDSFGKRSWSGLSLGRDRRVAGGRPRPSSLYTFPPGGGLGSGSPPAATREVSPNLSGSVTAGFPAGTHVCKSAASTDFAMPARLLTLAASGRRIKPCRRVSGLSREPPPAKPRQPAPQRAELVHLLLQLWRGASRRARPGTARRAAAPCWRSAPTSSRRTTSLPPGTASVASSAGLPAAARRPSPPGCRRERARRSRGRRTARPRRSSSRPGSAARRREVPGGASTSGLSRNRLSSRVSRSRPMRK